MSDDVKKLFQEYGIELVDHHAMAEAAERLLLAFARERRKYRHADDLRVMLDEAAAGKELYPDEG